MSLTLTYTGLVTLSGGCLIAVVYAYMRFVPFQLSLGSPSDGGVLDISLQLTLFNEFLDALLASSLVALLILALVSAAVSWFVAGRVLTPVATVADAARRVAQGNLDEPVALGGPHDEIRDLSDAFDAMQESVKASIGTHRRFAANASHELRTPLATIQTLVDVTLSDPQVTADDFRDVLGKIRQVNSANAETLDALLDLSDAQMGTLNRELVDLAGIMRESLSPLKQQMAAKNLRVSTYLTSMMVEGDHVLLRQALSNLVRNAIVHNVDGGMIDITVCSYGHHGDTARVSVSNDGPRVDPARVSEFVEPFVKASGRSSTRDNGHGLGLAITQTIADAHHATLTLTPRVEGGMLVFFDMSAATSDLPQSDDGGPAPT
ncbi:sensor histidine kinase [Actinomyces culturomici]|uniref:sensor histidine kinase n=1 Tax=Actinomyces culturomici TaxID=1926276 RepID=UPI00135C5F71|nr:HAMP domain-containing sensor histidine kinase [Actinomyces culturomici]